MSLANNVELSFFFAIILEDKSWCVSSTEDFFRLSLDLEWLSAMSFILYLFY